MNIFKYENYKPLVQDLIAQMPKKGRGQYKKMADELGVNSTVISQIFRGSRDITPEQALKLSRHLGFNETEQKFFIFLVMKERAGTKELENYFSTEAHKVRKASQEIKNRIEKHTTIKEEHKALFYSDWYYSGIRMLSALPEYNTVDDFAVYFNLNRSLVKKAVEFLILTGLCVEEGGKISVGPKNTHIGENSPLVNTHRKNWRLKALEKMNQGKSSDLFYSSPMSLSQKDHQAIREELVTQIAKVLKRVSHSPEEKVSCLNIDWFDF